MMNTDMIVGVVDTMAVTLTDMWSSGYKLPTSDESLSGSDDVTLEAYELTSFTTDSAASISSGNSTSFLTVVVFSRPIAASDIGKPATAFL